MTRGQAREARPLGARRRDKPFLTARWSNLALLTYPVPPALLERRVPPGLELDTRVLGVPWPSYRDFSEINLRFYVRDPRTVERGVCFVREFVPRRLVALLARTIYGEPYVAPKGAVAT